jgi:hypothetical protein
VNSRRTVLLRLNYLYNPAFPQSSHRPDRNPLGLTNVLKTLSKFTANVIEALLIPEGVARTSRLPYSAVLMLNWLTWE